MVIEQRPTLGGGCRVSGGVGVEAPLHVGGVPIDELLEELSYAPPLCL